MKIRVSLAAVAAVVLAPIPLMAQIGVSARPLPDEPFTIETAEIPQVRVTVMKGLELPWDLAFLPNGDILVTERSRRQLRIVVGREVLGP